jgi:hypothetical protein
VSAKPLSTINLEPVQNVILLEEMLMVTKMPVIVRILSTEIPVVHNVWKKITKKKSTQTMTVVIA